MTETKEPGSLPTGRAQEALARAIEPGSGMDLMSLATIFVQSGYFPDVKGVAQGVVKILAGRELGFGPVASLRHVYIHQGHLGLMATLVASKVRLSGLYDYKITSCDDTRCEIEFYRLVNGKDRVLEGTSVFTMEEAKRAGLVKPGSAWTTYPSDLLFARAMTRGQRRYAPEVFQQTVYAPEELAEIAAATPLVAEPPEDFTPKRTDEKVASAETSDPELVMDRTDVANVISVVPGFGPVTDSPAGVSPPDRDTLPTPTTFTIGTQAWATRGITKEQVLATFELEGRLKKKGANGQLFKTILKKEFQVEHRRDLTQDQAEKLLVRLKECVGEG